MAEFRRFYLRPEFRIFLSWYKPFNSPFNNYFIEQYLTKMMLDSDYSVYNLSDAKLQPLMGKA